MMSSWQTSCADACEQSMRLRPTAGQSDWIRICARRFSALHCAIARDRRSALLCARVPDAFRAAISATDTIVSATSTSIRVNPRAGPPLPAADASGYRFQILRDRQWRPIDDDADLRERIWSSPVALTLNRADGRRDLEFGRDPVDSPFVLSLTRDGSSVQLSANGLGLFEVLP